MPEAHDINITARGAALLKSTVVWDNHGCMPLRTDETFLPQLDRYRKAGVTVASLNVGFGDMSWSEHMQVLSFMRQWIAQHSDGYRLIATPEDIRECKRLGKLGIVFDIEGMRAVQENPSLVHTFYDLGVRWMLIAYNRNNAAGGGCLDTDTGLTAVGRTIIDEMQRAGMVLCLSHTGARTAAEAIDYARNPVIFSHSNPSALTSHPRNISDELMRACARKGGVIGLSGIGPYLGVRDELVDQLLRQLRYVVDLIGAEHVGLGLDYVFDSRELVEFVRLNPSLFPPDLHVERGMPMVEPEAIAEVAERLARDNFTDDQIRGILGCNWLRIATQVWK